MTSFVLNKIGLVPRFIVVGLVALLNVVHPFIHGFEGGALDVILVNLDMLLLHLDGYVAWHDDDHCEGH